VPTEEQEETGDGMINSLRKKKATRIMNHHDGGDEIGIHACERET
jgi:hypothetical protein